MQVILQSSESSLITLPSYNLIELNPYHSLAYTLGFLVLNLSRSRLKLIP